ncbi:hypothetical protein AB205_0211610 [Aquarana catesbeiana]|uniref:Uncharacterized protein n=1 Tax=Aquarana catesbeiana TaxID=8400 RepID=A0A2G9SI81_AQUCT|nr:hypothetical protein AB205_0211610 [Aquarana catesbeiana]
MYYLTQARRVTRRLGSSRRIQIQCSTTPLSMMAFTLKTLKMLVSS